MGRTTKIAFCHHTWSPWRGCEHALMMDGSAHPGCLHCYAEAQASRRPDILGSWGPNTPRALAAEKYWRLPFQWNRAAQLDQTRRRVFPSLMDPFEARPDLIPHRTRLFQIIDACPSLDFLLFTKRPQEIQALWPTLANGTRYRPNVWLLYSASDQASLDSGTPALLECRALSPVLGLSLEPLTGPLDLRQVAYPDSTPTSPHTFDCRSRVPGRGYTSPTGTSSWIDWCVIGGESGPWARPCALDWIRSIRDACLEEFVALYIKQLGTVPTWTTQEPWADARTSLTLPHSLPGPKLHDPKGGNPEEWPDEFRSFEYPLIHCPPRQVHPHEQA